MVSPCGNGLESQVQSLGYALPHGRAGGQALGTFLKGAKPWGRS
jgi:hypothetical protein